MDFLTRVKYGSRALDESKGFTGMLVNKGERVVGAAGFGFLKGYFREKSIVMGVPADLGIGLAATIAGAVLEVRAGGWTGTPSTLAPHLHAIGDAGLMSFFNSMGASYGAKKSGRQVLVLEAGKTPPAALPPGYKVPPTAVGEISPAVGAYLSPEEIANYATKRA